MNDRHLYNLRLADDILWLAASMDNAICMFEILTLELADIYFILNTKKKVLATQVHDFYNVVLHDIYIYRYIYIYIYNINIYIDI